jgi:hypothetical protein
MLAKQLYIVHMELQINNTSISAFNKQQITAMLSIKYITNMITDCSFRSITSDTILWILLTDCIVILNTVTAIIRSPGTNQRYMLVYYIV